jgi:hypothetical protein
MESSMDDGRWTMDDGRWTMDDGRWTMDDGQSDNVWGKMWKMVRVDHSFVIKQEINGKNVFTEIG